MLEVIYLKYWLHRQKQPRKSHKQPATSWYLCCEDAEETIETLTGQELGRNWRGDTSETLNFRLVHFHHHHRQNHPDNRGELRWRTLSRGLASTYLLSYTAKEKEDTEEMSTEIEVKWPLLFLEVTLKNHRISPKVNVRISYQGYDQSLTIFKIHCSTYK